MKSKKAPACRQGREFTGVNEYFFDKYNANSRLYGQALNRGIIKTKTSIDENICEKGLKISDEEFKEINIEKEGFHGEWNYVIKPPIE